jgi:hypothetical protein
MPFVIHRKNSTQRKVDAIVISKELLDEVKSYIDKIYIDKDSQESFVFAAPRAMRHGFHATKPHLDDLVGNLDEPFSKILLR